MFHHVTVLKEEAVAALDIKPDGIYVDCTLGGAGHSEQIASRLGPNGLLLCLDQDDQALAHAEQRLAPYKDRVRLIKSNFRYLREVLDEQQLPSRDGIPLVNGILYDLGVSSPQLDEAERGFSYNHDAPLDMRMDRTEALTAADVVNEWPEEELRRILWQYGEEKFAKSIARRIVQARSEGAIRTTGQLAELIKQAIPAAARRSGPHPAKRSFQAIRIAVNDELGAFEQSLEQAITCLDTGGRVAVITFHSLEDRICKQMFAKFVETCTCPPDFPVCVCRRDGVLKLVNRKPWTPDERELEENPRARSAKLRAAEKLPTRQEQEIKTRERGF
ncbi:16S rRNA (cytosine(1402)-N(4))-methyltransferase RsmH [Xylanibacillus composti]|uniref:Ribosomal RNA small subunit methyltransferase H n=1 Tax=Xylanibacillus composti TaxID=1572762 RepID=A0A8J4H1P7_9BACL|nr:16S rRNA (cytosine(1402)-N(4))-methyltransferase RsmH [Xylanibacillus composti]MDT9724375.1 16S rRNA (cytosine(1402)-N(4))-methyltransferase RsmH [Xylanibacillus composti]GIQ67966.1 ribosomal RNA small subunit methyltransferase H [Xylanibacillus composti]